MLDGGQGEACRQSMEILCALGKIYGADDMVAITTAQVAGVSYKTIGDAGLEYLQDAAKAGARVRIPTFLTPAGMDREQAKAVRRQAFGFSLPAFTLFDRGATKEEPVDRITIEVSDAYKNGERKWVMTSNEGVVWVQTDDESVNEDPHKGSKVAIRKAAIGSFFCNIDGQRAVRCERRR